MRFCLFSVATAITVAGNTSRSSTVSTIVLRELKRFERSFLGGFAFVRGFSIQVISSLRRFYGGKRQESRKNEISDFASPCTVARDSPT